MSLRPCFYCGEIAGRFLGRCLKCSGPYEPLVVHVKHETDFCQQFLCYDFIPLSLAGGDPTAQPATPFHPLSETPMKYGLETTVRVRFNGLLAQVTGRHEVVGSVPQYDVVYVTETGAVVNQRFPEFALTEAIGQTPPWGELVPPPEPGTTPPPGGDTATVGS